MGPELLDPERFGLKKSRPTKQSDCYALGMVVYEVLSGQTPFAPSNVPVVIWKVLEGHRPERPQGSDGKHFTDGIWRVVQLCWEPQPHDRINAKTALLGLGGDLTPLQLLPGLDEDVKADGNDWLDTTASDSGMFPLFHLKLTFDYPCGTIDLLVTHGDLVPLSNISSESSLCTFM